ncbi:MAG: sulfotransferase [Flavobacteriales bacterium]|nr:sulfotransferase [Flavobacteriales bacterium]
MNQKPIFILGAHKSGTTLLRNLLSGHPDLFVVPFESHFFQLTDRNVDYEYRKNTAKGLSKKQIEQNLVDWIKTSNEAVDPMGDTFVTGKLDLDRFKNSISLSENDSTKQMFEKYMESIHQSLSSGLLPDSKRVVEKSVENAEFAIELSEMFPDARFIHIVRNPYSNFVSLRKYKSVGVGFPLLNRMVKTFRNSYHYLFENQKYIKNYKVVRYEDILSQTESTMQSISEFLNIEFLPILLRPSHLGESWGGNSTTGEQFEAVSDKHADRWKNDLLPIEIACANEVAGLVLQEYEYERLSSRKSFYNKEQGETFFRFIFNRWFVFTQI